MIAKDVQPAKAPSFVCNNVKACKDSLTSSVKPTWKGTELSSPVKISSATATSLGIKYHEVEQSNYRITPMPPHRKSGSPPSSPIVVHADVHLDTSQKKQLVTPTRTASSHCEGQQEGKKGKAYQPPSVAPKELSVRVSGCKKSVKFVPEVDLSDPLPPPLPPRVPATSTPPSYKELGLLPTPTHSRCSISSPSSYEVGKDTTVPGQVSQAHQCGKCQHFSYRPDQREKDSNCELPPRSL